MKIVNALWIVISVTLALLESIVGVVTRGKVIDVKTIEKPMLTADKILQNKSEKVG